MRPGEAGDLVIRAADDVDRALLAALHGDGDGVDGLRRALGVDAETLAAKLGALAEAGVLVIEEAPPVALPPELAARFDRQLPYFAETEDGGAAQLRLRAATVAILGCGGLGTWALAGLASAGVGGFVLIDDDAVELSNLNRQVLYRAADVGASKAARAGDWVRAFDPSVRVRAVDRRVEGVEDLLLLLEGADLLVQTADWPPYRILRWVDEACRRQRVPYIIGGQRPPVLKVGPTFVPGRSACFACQEAALERDFPLFRELSRKRDERPARSITLGPASGIAGTLIAAEAMHLLLGRRVATEGRALILDLRTLACRWEAIERLADCPGCHHLGGDA